MFSKIAKCATLALEIEREKRQTDEFLSKMNQQNKEETSSSEEEQEETKAPESPGKWEIMPGSSATRPQESDLAYNLKWF